MASSVGLGDPDAPATFDDFVAAFARAVSLRTAHIAGGGARAPAPPRRASARRLRDIFLSACVDFDGAKKRSNANTLALPRWRRLCVGSGFVARKFPAAAADVVFAKTRRAGERELRAEDFASALAHVAAETGRTFECVVDAAAKCAAGGCLSAGVAAARVAASARREPRQPRDGVHASLDDRALLRIRPHSKPRSKPVVSVRESFPPARPAPTAAPEPESRLDAALSCPRAEDFDAGDVDGDGLLSPAELAGVLMRSCHADEADAVHLTRVCFEDVDLDKDGRVSFEEYRAFCKKAKRVLRRRALAAHATREDVQKSAGVRRLTFGTDFGSSCARWDTSRESVPPRLASARLDRSLDALRDARERPACAPPFSRSFSGAARGDASRGARASAEDSRIGAMDLTTSDTGSVELTVDEACVLDDRDVTHDLEPVAETVEEDDATGRAREGSGREEGSRAPFRTDGTDADARQRDSNVLFDEETNDRNAVWRAEFDAHDAHGTGRLDLELATFALAKLRLLEDLEVELAAQTLETRLAETDGGEDVALDFEAFARFAKALESARRSSKRRSTCGTAVAQPVPVRKEYALDPAHPFLALFREMADSREEMDGETFACVLRAARLADDARLTDTGVDVIFARARARHQAERTARRVPYRIFLGALSLAAGHLGLDFETAAARVVAGAEAARARAAARAFSDRTGDAPLHGKENTPASPVLSVPCGKKGKKNTGEKKRSRLSAVFGGRA